jgi:hypothetical protein
MIGERHGTRDAWVIWVSLNQAGERSTQVVRSQGEGAGKDVCCRSFTDDASIMTGNYLLPHLRLSGTPEDHRVDEGQTTRRRELHVRSIPRSRLLAFVPTEMFPPTPAPISRSPISTVSPVSEQQRNTSSKIHTRSPSCRRPRTTLTSRVSRFSLGFLYRLRMCHVIISADNGIRSFDPSLRHLPTAHQTMR